MQGVMDAVRYLLDIFLHLDEHLHAVMESWGPWTYVLLFAIILCETGLVVTPFLPGDSLLFAAGALAALYPDHLDILLLLGLLFTAAVLGDTLNYAIGRWVGPRAFRMNTWFLKHENLEKTQAFYDKHGGKTIVLARFVPIVRTFAPVVAGVGVMDYRTFVTFNLIGGFLWAVGVTTLGFFLGEIDAVEQHLEIAILAIVALSLLPVVVELVRHRRGRAHR